MQCRFGLAVSVLLLSAGCGDLEGDHGAAHDQERATLSAPAFSNTSPLCPVTTKWGAWPQTSLTTWDSDVKPIVGWIVDLTGISSSTYAGHSPSIGRAADWRPHSREEGTRLANWFLDNTGSSGTPLGIDYIIWQAQIYQPASGVKTMADRGSFTQNHCDHVHISFKKVGAIRFDPESTTPWGDDPGPDAGLADSKVHPAQHDTRPPDPQHADAGVSPPDPIPYLSTEPPASLQGGCTMTPGAQPGLTDALWLLLLLGGSLLSRRRTNLASWRRTPH